MNGLIGDIGNTVTKICLIDVNTFKIKKMFYFQSKDINSNLLLNKNFIKILKRKNFVKKTLFSSVVPKYTILVKKFLKKKYKINFFEIKDSNIDKIIKINIKKKSQVGSDRIANAVGAYKKYKRNAIILDFGTATTFDVVTNAGVYNGGVIAPGVNLSLKSLVGSADQIPQFSIKRRKKIIGKNTLEALRAGFYWGYTGLINNIILKIEKETGVKYKIIFTGGYSNLFKSSIIRPFHVDTNITINGIIEIYKHNKLNYN